MKCFDNLKKLMSPAPVLGYPNFSNLSVSFIDALETHFRITSYLSRTLNPAEIKKSPSETEYLAIVHELTTLKPYLLGTNVAIMTASRSRRERKPALILGF